MTIPRATKLQFLETAELTPRELRSLGREHPELADCRNVLAIASDDAEALRQTRRMVEGLLAQRDHMSRVIEAMVPPIEVPGRAAILQARRNARAREGLLRELGALDSAQVADLAGSKATNRAALANRWRKDGRILAVEHRGRTYFPSFQFDDEGRPFPAIAEVLEAFDGEDGWETALWFLAANGWLGGERPVDVLAEAPERVTEAARHSYEDRVF